MDTNNNFNTINSYLINLPFIGLYTFFISFLKINYKNKLILGIIILTYFSLIFNMISSKREKIDSTEIEKIKINVIEEHASIILTLSIGIAFFVDNIYSKNKTFEIGRLIKLIVISFFCSVIILFVVWLPLKEAGYYRNLRDAKSNMLIFSLSFILIAVIGYFQK